MKLEGNKRTLQSKAYCFLFIFLGYQSVTFLIDIFKYRHDLLSTVIFIMLFISCLVGSYISYTKAYK